jgi:hypothetical protein
MGPDSETWFHVHKLQVCGLHRENRKKFTGSSYTFQYQFIANMGSTSSLIASEINAETLDTLKSMLVSKCTDILKDHPGNRCCKYCIEYIKSEEANALSNEG